MSVTTITGIGTSASPEHSSPNSSSLLPKASTSVSPGGKYSKGFHYVVKKNGETVGDIVASMHNDEQGKGIDRLNPTVEEAAKIAKVVAFESAFDDQEMTRLHTHRQTSKSQTRKNYSDYHAKNYDATKITKFQPRLTTHTELPKLSPTNGTETLIKKICQQTDSDWVSLETPEGKAEACNYIEMEAEFLKSKGESGAVSMQDYLAAFNETIAAYHAGDEKSYRRVTRWLKRLDPSRYYHLTRARNLIQANSSKDLIKAATPDKRALIVIGVEHMLGKKGVVNLLRKDFLGSEYSIERMDPPVVQQTQTT